VDNELKYRLYNYPVNQMYGLQTNVVTTLTNSHRIDSLEDARDYISRVKRITPLFEQLIENLKIREDSGIVLPRHLLPQVVNVCENLVAEFKKDTKQHILYQDFKEKLEKIEADKSETADLLKEMETALQEHFEPSYEKLISFLKEQEKRAPASEGVWKFPGGYEFYQYALRDINS